MQEMHALLAETEIIVVELTTLVVLIRFFWRELTGLLVLIRNFLHKQRNGKQRKRKNIYGQKKVSKVHHP